MHELRQRRCYGSAPHSVPPAERSAMGEPNNALKAYIKRPDRIRSVLEYYLGEGLPEDWECSQTDGRKKRICAKLSRI